jgi:hypothetical protein
MQFEARRPNQNTIHMRPLQGRLIVGHLSGGVAPGYCLVPLRGTVSVHSQ